MASTRCAVSTTSQLAYRPTGPNGIGIDMQLYPERLADKSFVLYLLIFGDIVSVLALLIIPRWSYRPLED